MKVDETNAYLLEPVLRAPTLQPTVTIVLCSSPTTSALEQRP